MAVYHVCAQVRWTYFKHTENAMSVIVLYTDILTTPVPLLAGGTCSSPFGVAFIVLFKPRGVWGDDRRDERLRCGGVVFVPVKFGSLTILRQEASFVSSACNNYHNKM